MQGSPPIPLGEGMAGDLSPDGKWAATVVSYTQILLLPTGAGTVKRIEKAGMEHYGHQIHWMPDGKQIVFSGNLPGHEVRCFIQNIDGGKPRPITPEGVGYCAVSPDGQLVVGKDLTEWWSAVVSNGWWSAACHSGYAAGRDVCLELRPARFCTSTSGDSYRPGFIA